MRGLAKLVRGSLGGTVHVHAVLTPPFAVFEVEVIALPEGETEQAPLSQQEQEGKDAAEARNSQMDALDRGVQKKSEQEQRESSQANSQASNPQLRRAASGFSAPAPSSQATAELAEGVKTEVDFVEQTLRMYLVWWVSTFPPPETRGWAIDFEVRKRDAAGEGVDQGGQGKAAAARSGGQRRGG